MGWVGWLGGWVGWVGWVGLGWGILVGDGGEAKDDVPDDAGPDDGDEDAPWMSPRAACRWLCAWRAVAGVGGLARGVAGRRKLWRAMGRSSRSTTRKREGEVAAARDPDMAACVVLSWWWVGGWVGGWWWGQGVEWSVWWVLATHRVVSLGCIDRPIATIKRVGAGTCANRPPPAPTTKTKGEPCHGVSSSFVIRHDPRRAFTDFIRVADGLWGGGWGLG